MEGRRHEQAAGRADAAGNRRAADQHRYETDRNYRYETDRNYGRAREHQPRSSLWRPLW